MDVNLIYGICGGVIIGACFGLLIAALCCAASKGDKDD